MAIKRRTAFVVGVAGTALVAGTAVVQAAYTDNMYPTNNYSPTCRDGGQGDTFCQTDNKTLTVYREGSLTSAEKSAISRAVKDYYGPTDLAVKIESRGVYAGGSETDIIYKAKTLARGKIGIAWCDDAVSSRKCDQHHIAFNKNNDGIGPINKSDACHETGHAVGLTHGPEASPAKGLYDDRLGCMSYNDVYGLGANNKENINATY
ncbi:hypothetical protein ACIF8T_18070 [Streptomyces sp. NPDC085946]|uniref:hypothetical protein n=1 Tax=Streptomyces sp. NPDC085946 TaxID=3365744 RepID=UPI0037D78573